MRLAYLALLALAATVSADTQGPRAAPPEFSQDEIALFPDDAREMLVGDRPDFAPQQARAIAESRDTQPAESTRDWGGFISVETAEGEIKRQANRLAPLVRTPNEFRAGGHTEAREAFTTLAVMFAVLAEHEDDARWRRIAPALAAAMGKAAANCKTASDGAYRDAQARSEDLTALLRGGRPDTNNETIPEDWSRLADRSPIMVRMEQSLEERLSPLAASERQLSRGSEDALQEAQVLAALAEAILRPEQPDADDDDYAAYARDLRDAAVSLRSAAEQENYEAFRAAVGAAGQACSRCHEEYRG